ncbi:MAG: 7-cyano-7-deazaguanine synthase [Candidatus Omnitrophica bacterium]|nr:7-cyano-7-deazaguanine synthase [Candidatus Omnitrophota bacterium]
MRAIALISGGLDSRLAAKFVKEEGVDIIPLNFRIPFCHRERNNYNLADEIRKDLGTELKKINLAEDFLEIVKNPKHGYGSNINPCIDCKILMLRKAGELMQGLNAKFIITGEVLGQRPMSQHRDALKIIEKESGLEGLVLRPLSAKLLEETIPERENWINRNKLLSFSGRTRRPQIELAKNLDIQNYPNAGGGCLLTDPEFTKRLKELIAHRELSIDNVALLKIGRHFRISDSAKLIVGRDEQENKELEDLARADDYLFFPGEDLAGPTTLGRGEYSDELIELSCRLTSSYCDLNGQAKARIFYRKIPENRIEVSEVLPLDDAVLVNNRI